MKDQPKPSRAGVLHAVIEEILARNDGHIPTNIEGPTPTQELESATASNAKRVGATS